MKRLAINIGFITNSSSCIYWFPKEILEDPTVDAFLSAYGFKQDFIGESLSRSCCATFTCTLEGWNTMADRLSGGFQTIRPGEPGDVIIMYGDEHPEDKPFIRHILEVLDEAADRLGLGVGGEEFH